RYETLVVDFPRCQHAARFPHDRSGSDALALMPAVEHGTDRERDRGNVDGRRGHQRCWRGLVATDRQYHAIDRIAEQHFDEAEIREISIEPRCRALAGFLNRMNGKLERDAAGVANTLFDPFDQDQMVTIAR